ncbi:MAG TPA: nucleotide exchange factor GrpE [Candidatus Paceibacterota bacterium]|nr:nucleotide exchange factor GrpE [Candidatus Paceibacterota bacterium]
MTEHEHKKEENKAEEYLENWKRERADFLNYKKDEARRLEEFAKFANEDVLLEVMDIVDDLELAAKELKDMGLEQVLKKFRDLFKKYGVERIRTDIPFDPMMHEAVETEPGGTKLDEVRAGYVMRDKVIRPSRVRIIK